LTFAAISVGLAAIVVVLLTSKARPGVSEIPREVTSEATKEAAVSRLVELAGGGIFDSFPDPLVGRVLLPNLKNRDFNGTAVSSNRFGLRERDYELPKPANLLRVVLLGDSYIMGLGVRAEERCGVFLERQLIERAAGFTGSIECLHIGVGGWNVVAECSFLRRQLFELRPDLVIQVMVDNDLDDNAGVRGFGTLAQFSTQHADHVDGIIQVHFPVLEFGSVPSFLNAGLDFESRCRYQEAAAHIARLAADVEKLGGRYLLILSSLQYQSSARKALGDHLPHTYEVPLSFFFERRYYV
jgi:hypothetical protein